MQPSEEDQGQSVVLASHSGLGFVAVHVGKVSVKSQQTFLQLSNSVVKQHNFSQEKITDSHFWIF